MPPTSSDSCSLEAQQPLCEDHVASFYSLFSGQQHHLRAKVLPSSMNDQRFDSLPPQENAEEFWVGLDVWHQ